MGADPPLTDRLETIQRRWESLTEGPAEPRSVMNVVEYGLGEQRRAEVYVNRLLRYLLDPDEPHGLGTDFLRAFLDGLPQDVGFREDLSDLSDIDVGEQVSIRSLTADGETDRQGWLDLFIDVRGEWFLLVELKFAAAETGTEFYCGADRIDGRPVDSYESGHYYLYLHNPDEPEAAGACFTSWTWAEFVDDVLEPFILEKGSRYPQRTVHQLSELRYDLQEITGMTDHDHTTDEKADLYVQYYDAVSDITDAFEDRWETFAQEWPQRLADRIDDPAVLGDWVFHDQSTDWAFIYRRNWWRRTDTFEPVSENTDPRRVRVGFLHRLEGDRDHALGEQTLRFKFRNTPPNRHLENDETNFRDLFIERFDARRDEIEAALPERSRLTGNMHNRIEAEYDISVAESEDFFTAYISALDTAVSEHIVENEALVEALDATYEETLEAFR